MPSIKAEQKKNALHVEQTHVMNKVILQQFCSRHEIYHFVCICWMLLLHPYWSNQPRDSDMTPWTFSSQKYTLFLHSCGSLARGTWSASLWCLPLKSHQPQFSCNCRPFNSFKRELFSPTNKWSFFIFFFFFFLLSDGIIFKVLWWEKSDIQIMENTAWGFGHEWSDLEALGKWAVIAFVSAVLCCINLVKYFILFFIFIKYHWQNH